MSGPYSKHIWCHVVNFTLILVPSQENLGVKPWELDRYARADWNHPSVVHIESIDCHVGRQTIDIRGTKVWVTVPLHQVSGQLHITCLYSQMV